jgi:AcrR family transcriptional regulator
VCLIINSDSLMMQSFSIKVNEQTYLKDPQNSELGVKIVQHGIDVLSDLGYEEFTFKKLANEIGSTEASVYRYFENKHKFVLYLSSWYWNWMNLRLMLAVANIDDPKERLRKAILLLTSPVERDINFSAIDELKLHKIVISESAKIYFSKRVDEDNKLGLFAEYKQLVHEVSNMILEVKPDYKYPHMLVSTVIEGCYNQRYFMEHLPRLTDHVIGEDAIQTFFSELVFNTIN